MSVAEDTLSREGLAFVERLHRELSPRRLELLEARQERQRRLDAGENPGFLAGTGRSARATGKSPRRRPISLDRRCEITGPVDRKMMINALNSGGRVFMADFEDANSPTWENVVQGHAECPRLRSRGELELKTPDEGLSARTTRSRR